jgi:hypothetical protein
MYLVHDSPQVICFLHITLHHPLDFHEYARRYPQKIRIFLLTYLYNQSEQPAEQFLPN